RRAGAVGRSHPHAGRGRRAQDCAIAVTAGVVMSKKKRPRWKGDLAKPIYVGDLPFHASGKEASAWLKQAVGRGIMEKLRLLMKHYRIADKDDYLGLALALARDFVPGFQVINTKLKLRHGTWGAVVRANAGRPITWPPERLDRLLKVVEETKQQRGLSDRDALKNVIQKGEW